MATLRKFLIIAVGVVALLALGRAAHAQAPTPAGGTPTADDVNRVARQMFCPVCENIPLDVCPTTACAKWRETIREKLAAGWTDQQILDYFVTQYGERVLANPSTHGLNVLLWALPPVALVAGVAFLWLYFRRVTRAAPSAAAPEVPLSDKYVEQLEKELEKRR
jgi:cytochrome c-type biogenesis protein CcmH